MTDEIYYGYEEIREFVLDKMREFNMYPANPDITLKMDNQIHRYQIEGREKGTTDGAYLIHPDGTPAGYLKNWAANEEHTWKIENGKGYATTEKSGFDIKLWQEEQKRRDAERERRYLEAAERARIRFDEAFDGEIWHEYLTNKQVKPYGIRLNNETKELLIPLRDINGSFQTLEMIKPDGSKKYLTGGKKTGGFFSIGLSELEKGDGKCILIGEGFATMAKVYELAGCNHPVVAAMDCGNMKPVAVELRKKYPDRKIIVTADNDIATFKKSKVNPGLKAAQELIDLKLADFVVFPPFNRENPEGSDWDDYAVIYGYNKARDAMLEGEDGIKQFFMNKEQREEYLTHLRLANLLCDLDPSIQLPPQEFIGGLFPRGYLTIIAAPSGTGKTVFMQKVVSDLSVGGSFFDGFVENEPRSRSLIFAAEAGYDMLIRRGASFKWPIIPKNALVANQFDYERKGETLMLDDEQGWKNVKYLIDFKKPDIVFFDSFGMFFDKDENKSVDMKPICRQLANLAHEFNISITLIHHTRKRTPKERVLSLSQDDVIGTSIFNRYVALIIGIEPMQDDEKTLLVKPLKSWFSTFMPFTYKITEDIYGHSTVEVDLAPEGVNSSHIAVWNYLRETFRGGEWFSISQVNLSEISGDVSTRQLRRIFASFVTKGKMSKRGENKGTEYSLTA